MPPKGVQKSKAAKLLAAQSSSKSKGKKKKWAKQKLREKKNNKVVFNQALYEKVIKEVPRKLKVITVYTLCEQYKINCSLARRAIQEMLKTDSIKTVCASAQNGIYTRAKEPEPEKVAEAGKAAGAKKVGTSKAAKKAQEKADKEAAEFGDEEPAAE